MGTYFNARSRRRNLCVTLCFPGGAAVIYVLDKSLSVGKDHRRFTS